MSYIAFTPYYGATVSAASSAGVANVTTLARARALLLLRALLLAGDAPEIGIQHIVFDRPVRAAGETTPGEVVPITAGTMPGVHVSRRSASRCQSGASPVSNQVSPRIVLRNARMASSLPCAASQARAIRGQLSQPIGE